jgi:hypothetical protein
MGQNASEMTPLMKKQPNNHEAMSAADSPRAG